MTSFLALAAKADTRRRLRRVGVALYRFHSKEGRFPDAGRPPENHRTELIALDLSTQGLARAEQVLLADELFERTWAHPLSQGPAQVLSVRER